ncbi:MAG: sugar ABC transporter substrate-binding protein, partial [Streptococcaceae bacterium]|nr:sugar ABC transporter substrate-binding protein [Streptococcaceae bacterium]
MKKKFKIMSLTMTALSSGALLAACSSSSSTSSNTASGVKLPAARVTSLNSNSPAWKSDANHTKTLTWFVDQAWWNTNMGSDLVTKQIEKDLNLKINFVIGDDTKLNTYFASGKLPDIVTMANGAPTSQLRQTANTWALPLQTLASKYDPYWNKIAASQTMDWYKLSNGLTYGYPNYSNTQSDYKSGSIKPEEGFVIQKSIYEALGKPKMDTPADFVKVESEIHQKYPSLTTLGFTDLQTTVQDLIGVPYYQNGKYYDRNTDTDYIKWLGAIRQVHQAGGISDNDFTQAANNNLTSGLSTGKYATAIVGSAINNAAPLQTWDAAHPDNPYIVVTGVASTEGRKPALSQAGISGWLVNYITKDCKDPESAMEVFTYLQSEYGQMLVNYGIKGQTYRE